MENEHENAFHNFERSGWQKAAGEYDAGFGPVTRQAVFPLVRAAGAHNGARLLDVACGPGYVAAAASRLGCSAVGIDFAPAMVDIATKMYGNEIPGIEFRLGNAEELDFSDESFDIVVMNYGMLHLALPDRAISEAFRVLKPGGRYAFTVWAAPPATAAFEIVLSAVQLHGNTKVPLPEGPPFFRFSDAMESARSLTNAGFQNVESSVVPQLWKLKDGSELLSTMRRAAVRTAALLNLQEPEDLKRIEVEISSRANGFRKAGGIELPMPGILTCAGKPTR